MRKKDENQRPGVVFVSASDFPHGLSAPYRIRMFAKSFQSVGIRPLCVLQYAPGVSTPGLNNSLRGEFEGIEFVYPIGTLKPPTTKIRLIYYKFWGLYCVLKHIIILSRSIRVDYLFSYGNTLFEDLFYFLLVKWLRIKFIIEICDSPEIALNSHPGLLRKLKERLKYSLLLLRDRFIVPRADHLFVISHWLKERYSTVVTPDRILLTPIIGDADRSVLIEKQGSDFKRILWIGNFRPYEGLEFLLDSLGHLQTLRSDFVCHIFGVTPKWSSYAESIQALILSKGLGSIVRLFEAVPNDQVPCILSSADVLVNPRTDSVLNRSNFPTKLVDYLFSGRPVISSAIGEVSRYLVPDESVVFPADSSPQAFAQAINTVLSNPKDGSQIGRMGRQVAEKHFDYRQVGRHIGEVLPTGMPKA